MFKSAGFMKLKPCGLGLFSDNKIEEYSELGLWPPFSQR